MIDFLLRVQVRFERASDRIADRSARLLDNPVPVCAIVMLGALLLGLIIGGIVA